MSERKAVRTRAPYRHHTPARMHRSLLPEHELCGAQAVPAEGEGIHQGGDTETAACRGLKGHIHHVDLGSGFELVPVAIPRLSGGAQGMPRRCACVRHAGARDARARVSAAPPAALATTSADSHVAFLATCITSSRA